MATSSDEERRRLAATFDRAVDRYHRARPDYPDELVEHLLAVTSLPAGSQLLEVGCATGKATLPFARRGYRITCLEPGPALAAAARANLAKFDVDVVRTTLEDWRAGDERFALVYAATSWHWVDPAVRYRRAADALHPAGYLAFWTATHVFPPGGDPLFDEIQPVYDEIGEGLPAGAPRPRPGELPDETADIEASGRFEVVDVRQFDWETTHDAGGYLDLLDTFSNHIVMQQWQRDRLHGEIRRRLAARPDGRVRRHWGCVLHVARRRP